MGPFDGRYHAVRENLFARQPDIPARLFAPRTAYAAYLLENVLPGRGDGRPKPAARLLATEGVVSALFYRFVNAPAIQQRYRDRGFYARFGVEPAAVDPLDNAYLKVFASIDTSGYDAAAVVDAYARLFPDERAAASAVLGDTLLHQEIPAVPALWILNDAFAIGTSLFDQFRAPRLTRSSQRVLAGDLTASWA